jgi:hypothetical protein
MTSAQDLYPFDLGHQRLNQRAARIVQAALDHPDQSIPTAAGDRAATDATYRFLNNEAVVPEDLDAAHQAYTLGLLADTPGTLLVPQDTTTADFTSPKRSRTLGQLAHPRHFGFFIHSALALRDDGLPLGLLHQQVWMRCPDEYGKRTQRRRKETAAKESQRWLDTEQACVAALPADRDVVMLGDREADFYDYFALPRRQGQQVLVRAKPRRRLADGPHLLGVAVRQQALAGTLPLAVPRKDDKPCRQATLALRYGTFALQPPSTHPRRRQLPPLLLQAVLVEEIDPPAGVEPVQWLLLTTLPVTSVAQAQQVVRWYSYRWRIERYHFVLKRGCKLEELPLETAARLRRALALYAMVAARLLHLTYRARLEPEASCEGALSRPEWQVLWRRFGPGQAFPEAAPARRQAVHWIARLGGFLGRKHDGEPGVKVLWRGWQTLQAMVIGFQLGHVAHGVQSSDE